jgi:hypothetical protein
MKHKTFAKLAKRAGYTLKTTDTYQKQIAPRTWATIVSGPSIHSPCSWLIIQGTDVPANGTTINFERALVACEAWHIQDLERRADASMGLLFLAPQAE